MYVVLTCNIINIIWISQLQQFDRKPLKVFSKKLDDLVSFIILNVTLVPVHLHGSKDKELTTFY